jgi:hypothetical protein
MTDDMRAPPRLLQMVGPAGDCLREALAQRESTLAPPRFAALQERRLQRVRRQRLLALLTLVTIVGFGSHLLQREEPRPIISAELTVSASNPPPSVAGAAPSESPVAPESPRQSPIKTNRAPVAPKSAAPRASVDLTTRSNDAPPLDLTAKPPSVASEGGGSAKGCAQLARAGSAEQARDCYERLSSGSGMSAELALFEQARLEGKALRRPENALRTLEAHRRRFPRGSLRAEVMLAQIDWLLATGDSAHALQIVDEALASGLLRERTSELQRLRTTLAPANPP